MHANCKFKHLKGAIAAAVCLFAAPAARADRCASGLVPAAAVSLLNVGAAPDVPERVARALERRDPGVVESVPELITVLREAVRVSSAEGGALSVTLEHTATRPAVVLSLDLPLDARDVPVRRITDENLSGEPVRVPRFDIRLTSDEIAVVPAETEGIKTARGLMVRDSASHAWGVAIHAEQNGEVVIDTKGMRAEAYLSETAPPLYRRGLALALRLARALNPRSSRLLLSTKRALFEFRQGHWQPLPAPR